MKKSRILMPVKEMIELIYKDTILLDPITLNEEVYDMPRKVLEVYSMIENISVSTSFYFLKEKDERYEILSNQHICMTIIDYINNEFPLSISKYGFESRFEIDGKYFSELTEELKKRILNYNLIIDCFEGITSANKHKMFYRMIFGENLKEEQFFEIKNSSTEEHLKNYILTTKATNYAIYDYFRKYIGL